MRYLFLLLLTGCAGEPFVEMSAGYALNVQDWETKKHHVNHYDCRGAFQLKAGVENEDYSVGFAHDSHIECGAPFNDHKEFYRDYFFISKKWGGL